MFFFLASLPLFFLPISVIKTGLLFKFLFSLSSVFKELLYIKEDSLLFKIFNWDLTKIFKLLFEYKLMLSFESSSENEEPIVPMNERLVLNLNIVNLYFIN